MAESWLQHALRRTGWQPQRQVASLAVLGMFVIIFIGALYLSQSSATSTLGRQLSSLIEERDRLQQDNEALRAEIAGYRTVERLLRRAQELGFVQASAAQIQYLVVNGYNPQRQITVVALQPNNNVLPDYDESFTGWVQQQWDWLRRQVESFTSQEVR
jgi:predicted PurR-regulated permease PerM